MKRCLKVFGLDSVKAVGTDIKQLHDLTAVKPKNAKKLTAHERRDCLMFLKLKKTGQVKGRGCADGGKQRVYTDKDEATLPSIATDAKF